MEDMKKLYENKVKLLSNELTACLCKLDGEIEKIGAGIIAGYTFTYEGQEVFSIMYYDSYKYKITVYDKYTNGYKILNVNPDNSNISEVYDIMERKYEEHKEYSNLIEPINDMISILASYTNK